MICLVFFFDDTVPQENKAQAEGYPMRSKLFVPASRPELFQKALAGDADALSFDLEDAVAESRKDEAREILRSFLQSPAALESNKTIIVRINPPDSPHFGADLQAVLTARIDLLNVPKVASADEVRLIASTMERIEAETGVAKPISLLLNIETPTSLRNAVEIASAHARVAGLQLGYGDLFGPLAISRINAPAIEMTMFLVRMAAGEAGVFACDSAFADIKDPEGFRAEAARARDFGFVGKSCIHPSQVALANEIFRPTEAEIAHAVNIVASIKSSPASGAGAIVIDGKMIDVPYVTRAQAIVAQAEALGLLPNAASIRQ